MIKNSRGFTLVEMAIVITVIGLILAAVFKGGPFMITSSKIHSTMTLISDVEFSIRNFKTQYHYLPGDMPNATNLIPNTTNNGDGDGVIELSEVMFVSEHLFAAELIKNNGDSSINSPFSTSYGRAWLIASAVARSNTSPCTGGAGSSTAVPVDTTSPQPYAQHVVLLESLPGEVALAIDTKLDDGNYNAGKIRGSNSYSDTFTTCLAVPI